MPFTPGSLQLFRWGGRCYFCPFRNSISYFQAGRRDKRIALSEDWFTEGVSLILLMPENKGVSLRLNESLPKSHFAHCPNLLKLPHEAELLVGHSSVTNLALWMEQGVNNDNVTLVRAFVHLRPRTTKCPSWAMLTIYSHSFNWQDRLVSQLC